MTTVSPPPPASLAETAAAATADAAGAAGDALEETLETALSGTRAVQQRYLLVGLVAAVALGVLLLRRRGAVQPDTYQDPAYPPPVTECGPACAEQHTYRGACVFGSEDAVGPWHSDNSEPEVSEG